jgi:hypothetical protein
VGKVAGILTTPKLSLAEADPAREGAPPQAVRESLRAVLMADAAQVAVVEMVPAAAAMAVDLPETADSVVLAREEAEEGSSCRNALLSSPVHTAKLMRRRIRLP